ncbi:protein of unknown function [Algoriphagus locisalis]|uniref:DUF4270 domain-containing protein n=1 Tax=Algoriphagus locisalis TaxID=305507 RepID=A0A1I7E420_9BACT|nr:DUF4270 family protein [Algoriphagus locisalis]SFU18690.1 protein of unknown function [Algoriphagus locisalis]
MKSRITFCLFILILSSCYENSFLDEIPEVDLEDDFNIQKVEFTDISYSSYFQDSIVTSTKESFLLGNTIDPTRGEVKANPYFEFNIQSTSTGFDDETILDSVVFVLKIDNSHYDTLPEFDLHIYQLEERLAYQNDDDVFYDFESFPTNSVPLVSKRIQYIPFQDSIRITLPMEFGQDLFEKVRGSEKLFESNEDFLDYFPGFMLEVAGSSPLMLVSKESYISFYHKPPLELLEEDEEYQIPIGDASLGFSHIEVNRAGTPFSEAQDYVQFPASESQNMAIADELGYSAVRIDLGDLTYIEDVPHDLYISEANLYIPVKKGTYDGSLNQPLQQLDVYVIDKNNNTKSYLSQATLASFDEVFQEATYFIIPINDFVRSQISGSRQTDGLWLEVSPGSTFNMGYLVVGDNSSSYKSKLEITLIPLN